MSEHALSIILTVGGALFAALSTASVIFARYIARRLNINLSPDQLQALDKWVGLAVLYVEERTYRYLRGLPSDTPRTLTHVDKQKLAIQAARELAPDNLTDFSDKALAIAVDAKVQEHRRSSFPPPTLTPSQAPAAIALPPLPLPPLPPKGP